MAVNHFFFKKCYIEATRQYMRLYLFRSVHWSTELFALWLEELPLSSGDWVVLEAADGQLPRPLRGTKQLFPNICSHLLSNWALLISLNWTVQFSLVTSAKILIVLPFLSFMGDLLTGLTQYNCICVTIEYTALVLALSSLSIYQGGWCTYFLRML